VSKKLICLPDAVLSIGQGLAYLLAVATGNNYALRR
jgi:hypothetical protein